jgi:hypothetical protein
MDFTGKNRNSDKVSKTFERKVQIRRPRHKYDDIINSYFKEI